MVIGQQKPVSGHKLTGASVNNYHRVLDADAVRIVDLSQRNLKAAPLQLLRRKATQGVRQEQTFITEHAKGKCRYAQQRR